MGPKWAKIDAKAFSSEVDTGSRQENASKQKLEPGSDAIRAEQAPGWQLAASNRAISGRSGSIFQAGFRCRRGEPLLSRPEAIARRVCPDDRISPDDAGNGPRMQDDHDRRAEKAGRGVKDSRQQRLKLALRENLKRRKSQARGRSDEAAASSETADASLDDAGGEKPGQ